MARKNAAAQQAVKIVGGVSETARRAGVTRQAVQHWVRVGFPADRLLDLEKALGLPRDVLRPDIFKGYSRK